MKSGWVFGAVLGIVVGGGMLPSLVPDVPPVELRGSLEEAVPESLGEWRAVETGQRAGRADPDPHVVRRRYSRTGGEEVRVVIRYYPRGAPHTPATILAGRSWEPSAIEVVPLAGETGAVHVKRMLVTDLGDSDERETLVVSWYHERGRVIATETWAKLYQIWDRLVRRRADGAVVSISTGTKDGARARERVMAVAQLVFPLMRDSLPR